LLSWTDVPFGMNVRMLNTWLYYGGGLDLINEFHKSCNALSCPPETPTVRWVDGIARRSRLSMTSFRRHNSVYARRGPQQIAGCRWARRGQEAGRSPIAAMQTKPVYCQRTRWDLKQTCASGDRTAMAAINGPAGRPTCRRSRPCPGSAAVPACGVRRTESARRQVCAEESRVQFDL
jgi:hypothetical protein